MDAFTSTTLNELGVAVSTGRVVDFRAKECLVEQHEEGSVPLIYPGNIRNGTVKWPQEIRKSQWFYPVSDKHKKMLVPEGWYCVVKRFSSKEERRRIVAAVWSPEKRRGPVAFENHVNVFHANGSGLDHDLAVGLSLWSTQVLWINSSAHFQDTRRSMQRTCVLYDFPTVSH